MRLVIDLQGAQGSSRHRGIGRYGMSLSQGLIRNAGGHEVFVTLNGAFPDTIAPIRTALHGLIPPENIVVWEGPAHVSAALSVNDGRRYAAQLVRESVLAQLDPDYVLVTSLFEGFGDDIVTSVGELSSNIPTAVVLYDLIPLIHRGIYLSNPGVETWYERKLTDIRNADLLLAISESARQESVDFLGLDDEATINISTAADDHFTPATVDAATRTHLAQALGLTRPFVMYTGGIDHRKNIEGLIEAYSRLPATVRRDHQLAIVCSIPDGVRERLLKLAADFGLAQNDLILTGYISDDDLLAAYRACKLFVFPSWHEGFGLPALEAMKCGRAVIAGNRSSLPEVIEREDALFDPFDLDAITRKIAQVLADDDFRAQLERHGLQQAKKFNWNETARRAWKAMEASHARSTATPVMRSAPMRRPRLAFVSPLPPEASGISDYSAELLPELARHYRIDVIATQDSISDPWIRGNCSIRDIAWFRSHAHEFDRILYHFGNSHFHTHMFDLLSDHPGVVVLHDFFLSAIMGYRDAVGDSDSAFPRALLDAHGWPALIKLYEENASGDAAWAYPCNLHVIQNALGIIAHAEYSCQLARHWFGKDAARNWHMIPLLRKPILMPDRDAARSLLGIKENDFVVCSFGMLGPMKRNDRLLAAWLASPLGQDPHCHLVFVGQNEDGDLGAGFKRAIRAGHSSGRVEITGRVDAATFRLWLTAADLGVQLRALSRGETSAAVLDCMNAGLATIANANGSMAELPSACVWLLDDEFTNEDLIEALTILWRDPARRKAFGQNAKARVEQHHRPRLCADAYADAIERDYERAAIGDYGVGKALAESDIVLSNAEWADLALRMSRHTSPRGRLKRLFVDVSELVQRDSRSGVQRVVRSILSHWLKTPPAGWIVEPVYAEAGIQGYRYARHFTSRFLGIWEGWCEDDRVEPFSGDAFIGLDLSPTFIPEQQAILQGWRRRGVTVQIVVYDLLPISLPELFPEGVPSFHHRWLEAIARFDGAICISRSVADDLRSWLDHYGPKRDQPVAIHWFHLGGDTENSVPTLGLPDNAEQTLGKLRATSSFLSVGTLEPRKGQPQTLAAFERLWADGVEANLIFVGKQGWLMDDFADHLRSHPQSGIRLLWLEAISDEYLDRIYASCSHLIAASQGEGFGLPLIEAGRHGISVLARDIPVFREVGGDAVTYFPDSLSPDAIETAIRDLLARTGQKKSSANIIWQTWEASAESLLAPIVKQAPPYEQWRHDGVLRLWGNDARMHSQVGKPHRRHILSNGTAGFLVYGPHLPVAAGSYRLIANGTAKYLTGNEFVDVVSERGEEQHFRMSLAAKNDRWRIEEALHLERAISDFEIRLWVDTQTELCLESIELIPA